MIIDLHSRPQTTAFLEDDKDYWTSVLSIYAEPFCPIEIAEHMSCSVARVLAGINLVRYGWKSKIDEIRSKSQFAFDEWAFWAKRDVSSPQFGSMGLEELTQCLEYYRNEVKNVRRSD